MDLYAGYTDDVLLHLLRQGDKRAFDQIYLRYWENMLAIAVKALRGSEEAVDVVQDVFFSLWKRHHELRIEGSLAAYLHTSIRYRAIHYIEKNITRRDYLALFADVAIHSLPPNAEMRLQLKETQEAIRHVVAAMPPKMKEVYLLSREEELSHKEIAVRMNISTETVKKHIQHALQLIRNVLSIILMAIAILAVCYICY